MLPRARSNRFPQLTFNFTMKVAHILKHRDLFPEFKQNGATFVVSAFETVNDTILARLNKGHTVADAENASDNPTTNFAAVGEAAYRMAGFPVPYWLPPTIFTPSPPRLTEDWFC